MRSRQYITNKRQWSKMRFFAFSSSFLIDFVIVDAKFKEYLNFFNIQANFHFLSSKGIDITLGLEGKIP